MFKNQKIHYEVMGHYHTQNQMEKAGGEIIMNGTFKGSNVSGSINSW